MPTPSIQAKLVIDTNVVVAAFRSRRGASHALMRYVAAGAIRPLCSTALFLEYETVLSREETRITTGHSLQDVEAVVNALAEHAQPVDIRFATRPVLPDPNDEIVLETAFNGRADAIVTHNLKDFGPARKFGVDIATPAHILGRLRH